MASPLLSEQQAVALQWAATALDNHTTSLPQWATVLEDAFTSAESGPDCTPVVSHQWSLYDTPDPSPVMQRPIASECSSTTQTGIEVFRAAATLGPDHTGNAGRPSAIHSEPHGATTQPLSHYRLCLAIACVSPSRVSVSLVLFLKLNAAH